MALTPAGIHKDTVPSGGGRRLSIQLHTVSGESIEHLTVSAIDPVGELHEHAARMIRKLKEGHLLESEFKFLVASFLKEGERLESEAQLQDGDSITVLWNRLRCCICGCSAEKDEFGDRVCWCDTCERDGCKVCGECTSFDEPCKYYHNYNPGAHRCDDCGDWIHGKVELKCYLQTVAHICGDCFEPWRYDADAYQCNCRGVFCKADGIWFGNGDRVLIKEGDLEGGIGSVVGSGREVEVLEGSATTVIHRVVQVKFQSAAIRTFRHSHLQRLLEHEEQKLIEQRQQLQASAERALALIEMGKFPQSCTQVLLPIVQKSSERARSGDLNQCNAMISTINSWLDQIAS